MGKESGKTNKTGRKKGGWDQMQKKRCNERGLRAEWEREGGKETRGEGKISFERRLGSKGSTQPLS